MTRRRFWLLMLALIAGTLGRFSVVLAAPARQADFPFPTTFGDNPMLVAVAIGFVMGPIIDFLNRRDWSSEAKAAAAFVWCMIAAGIAVYAMGQVNAADWFRTFLVVFVSAVALHRLYWKPSGISDAIDKATG